METVTEQFSKYDFRVCCSTSRTLKLVAATVVNTNKKNVVHNRKETIIQRNLIK